jgi:hypothetical protein
METLSKKTVTLLQDENFRKALRELVERPSEESKTINVPRDRSHNATGDTEQIIVRRIA